MKDAPNFQKFRTRQQVAAEYGLSYTTLWRRLKQHGVIVPPGLLSLRWQKKIFETLGYPHGVDKKDFENVRTGL